MAKTAGIYLIKIREYVYVGGSTDTYARKREHKRMLSNGEHHAKKLQEAYKKWGDEIQTPTHRVMRRKPGETKEVFRERLRTAEQEMIDFCLKDTLPEKGGLGYVLCNESHNAWGPDKKVKRYFSPEARARISIAAKGRVISENARKKMAEAKRGSRNLKSVRVVAYQHSHGWKKFDTVTAAAEWLGISQQLASLWISKKTWRGKNRRIVKITEAKGLFRQNDVETLSEFRLFWALTDEVFPHPTFSH
jgi:hypothetical protein